MKAATYLILVAVVVLLFSFMLVNAQVEFLDAKPLFNTNLNTSHVKTFSILSPSSINLGPNDEIWFHSQSRISKYSEVNDSVEQLTLGLQSPDQGVAFSDIALSTNDIVHINTKDVFIYSSCKIFKVVDGILQKIAGTGECAYTEDNVLASNTSIQVTTMYANGNSLYIYHQYRIRKIDLNTNIITAVIGNGSYQSTLPISAMIYGNSSLYFGSTNIFKFTNGTLQLVAGSDFFCSVNLTITEPSKACFKNILGFQIVDDELYILEESNIRKLTKRGTVEQVAGNLNDDFTFMNVQARGYAMSASSFIAVNKKIYIGEPTMIRVLDLSTGLITGLIGSLQGYDIHEYGIPFSSQTQMTKGNNGDYFFGDGNFIRMYEYLTNQFTCIAYFIKKSAISIGFDPKANNLFLYRSNKIFSFSNEKKWTIIADESTKTNEYLNVFVTKNVQSIMIHQDILYIRHINMVTMYHLRNKVFQRFLGNGIHTIDNISGYGGNATFAHFPTKGLIIDKYKNETYLSDPFGFISKINTKGILEIIVGNPYIKKTYVNTIGGGLSDGDPLKEGAVWMVDFTNEPRDLRYFGHKPNGDMWFKDYLYLFRAFNNTAIMERSVVPTNNLVFISCDGGNGKMYFNKQKYSPPSIYADSAEFYYVGKTDTSNSYDVCAINSAYVILLLSFEIRQITRIYAGSPTATTIISLTDASKFNQSSSNQFLYGSCDYGNEYFYFTAVLDGVFRYSIKTNKVTKLLSYAISYPLYFNGETTLTNFTSNWPTPIGNDLYFTHNGGIVKFDMVNSTSRMIYGGYKGRGMRRGSLYTAISSFSITSKDEFCFYDGKKVFGSFRNDIFDYLTNNNSKTSKLFTNSSKIVAVKDSCNILVGNTVFDTEGNQLYNTPENTLYQTSTGDIYFLNGSTLSILPVKCQRDEYFECLDNPNNTCFGIDSVSAQVCNGNGDCIGMDTCRCYDNSTTIDCAVGNSTTNSTNTRQNSTMDYNNSTVSNSSLSTNSSISNNITMNNTLTLNNHTINNITYNSTVNDIGNSTIFINGTNLSNTTMYNNTFNLYNYTANNISNYNITNNSSSINCTNFSNSEGNNTMSNSTLSNTTNTSQNSTIDDNNSTVLNSSQLVYCYGIDSNNSMVCNSNGKCISQDYCECFSDSKRGFFTSPNCSKCQQSYFGKYCLTKFIGPLRLNNETNGVEIMITSPYWYQSMNVKCGDLIHSSDLKLFGDSPKCYWKEKETSLFMIEFGNAFELQIGDSIRFNTNVFETLSTTSFVSFIVESPLNPIKPIAIISTRQLQYSTCENVIIDASNSYSLDRKQLSYIWSIHQSPNSIQISSTNSSVFAISDRESSLEGVYIVRLQVESSFSKAKSEIVDFKFTKSNSAYPILMIDSSSLNFKVKTMNVPLLIEKKVSLPSCYSNMSLDGLQVEWKQTGGIAVDFYINSNSDLVISNFPIKGTNMFSFNVTALFQSKVVSTEITIQTNSENLFSNLYLESITTQEALIVIENQDVEQSSEIETWSIICTDSLSKGCGSIIDTKLSNYALTKQTSFELNSIEFEKSINNTFSITLTINKGQRSVSSSIQLQFPTESLKLPPLISLLNVSPNRKKLGLNEILNLQLSITKSDGMDLINVDRNWFLNGDPIPQSFLKSTLSSNSIVLLLSKLEEGSQNVLKLQVTDLDTQLYSSYSYTFSIAKSPPSCPCLVSPSTGYALETEFLFSCENCQNKENSLTFSLSFVDDKSGADIPLVINGGNTFSTKLPYPLSNPLVFNIEIVDSETGASVKNYQQIPVLLPLASSVREIKSKVSKWNSFQNSLQQNDLRRMIFNSAIISRTSEAMVNALSTRRSIKTCFNGGVYDPERNKCICSNGFSKKDCSLNIEDFTILKEFKKELFNNFYYAFERFDIEAGKISEVYLIYQLYGLDSLLSNYDEIDSDTFNKSVEMLNNLVKLANENDLLRVSYGVDNLFSNILNSIYNYLIYNGCNNCLKQMILQFDSILKRISQILLRSKYIGESDLKLQLTFVSLLSNRNYRYHYQKFQTSFDSNSNVTMMANFNQSSLTDSNRVLLSFTSTLTPNYLDNLPTRLIRVNQTISIYSNDSIISNILSFSLSRDVLQNQALTFSFENQSIINTESMNTRIAYSCVVILNYTNIVMENDCKLYRNDQHFYCTCLYQNNYQIAVLKSEFFERLDDGNQHGTIINISNSSNSMLYLLFLLLILLPLAAVIIVVMVLKNRKKKNMKEQFASDSNIEIELSNV